jgi:large subunit ribosomal protein L31
MKKGIHPENYRPVVFKDMSVDHAFLVRSSVETSDTIEWEDGNTYPLVKLEISDKSHPFFTGKQKLMDSTGRVDRFNKKYGLKKDK